MIKTSNEPIEHIEQNPSPSSEAPRRSHSYTSGERINGLSALLGKFVWRAHPASARQQGNVLDLTKHIDDSELQPLRNLSRGPTKDSSREGFRWRLLKYLPFQVGENNMYERAYLDPTHKSCLPSGSIALKRFQHFSIQNAHSTITLWIFFACIELGMLALYLANTSNSAMVPFPTWSHNFLEPRSSVFLAETVLCFLSLSQFGFLFALDGFSAAAIFATTCAQLILFFVSLAHPAASCAYVPHFVRIWSLRRFMLYIFDGIRVLTHRHPTVDAARALVNSLSRFIAIMITFTGVFRINETFQGHAVSFVEALYLMLVTCSTIGYGDITPQTTSGKFLLMYFVFTFIYNLPPVLSLTQSMFYYVASVRGYEGSHRHVVVIGSPTLKEIVTLLNEFFVYSSNTAVVFVMLSEVTDRMRGLETTPSFRGRVAFVRVEYLQDKRLMERSKAAECEAIIVLSDKKQVVARGDYGAMMASKLFDRYVGAVPQLLWLRYGAHNSLLPPHHTVIVIDVIKKSIMATSLLLPGVIPFLVNLVRVSGSKGKSPADLWDAAAHGDDWRELYQYSRRNSLHCVEAPSHAVGRTMEFLVADFAEHCVVLLGIAETHRAMPVMNLDAVVKEGDFLILICELDGDGIGRALTPQERHIQQQTTDSPELIGDEESMNSSFYPFSQTNAPHRQTTLDSTNLVDDSAASFGATVVDSVYHQLQRFSGKLSVPLEQIALSNAEKSVILFYATQLQALGQKTVGPVSERIEADIQRTLMEAADRQLKAQSLDMDKQQKRRTRDGIEQFVIIDQSTSIDQSLYAEYDMDLSSELREQELVMMMQCIRSLRRRSELSLLSLADHKQEFQRKWRETFATPLRVVKGQGSILSHVQHALESHDHHIHVRGVLIYSSQQGRREYEDVPIINVERNVTRLMSDAMASHAMDPCQERHIVVELRTFSSCSFLEPRHRDAEWLRKGEGSFQSSLPFMMGKCFASDMLQTLLVHAFYHPAFLRLYELILNVSVRDAQVDLDVGSRLSGERPRTRFKFYGNNVMKLTKYSDAQRLILKYRRAVCIGVFRRFPASERLEGKPRYFITNPSPTMALQDTDVVYALYAGQVTEFAHDDSCAAPEGQSHSH